MRNQLNIRTDPAFQTKVELLAKKQGASVTKVVKDSVYNYIDSVYGSLRLLKVLVPLEGADIILEGEDQ